MRSRFVVLLIIALLVMSLVPASVLAGKYDPPTGMALRAGPSSHGDRIGAAPPDAPVSLVYDDGGYENSIGLTNQVTNSAAVWFVRFTPSASYPFNLTQIHVLWPTAADAQINLVGLTATLLVYTDTDNDGDPSNASLVYQQPVTIVNQDGVTFDVYTLTTPVALNGPGDVLIGFRDDWNLGGLTAANFPAAIDQTSSAVRSWAAGMSTTGVDPDINNLANNDVFGTIDSFGLPGNWLIRGAGETAAGPAISLVKTVGTTAGVCATTSSITVPAGTTVYYCYTVTNVGDTTLNTHDLSDDQLGSIFTGTSYALAPGASVSTVDLGLTISAVINTTTTNVGTWSAYNAGGTPVTANATATVNTVEPRCQMGYHEVPVLSEGFDGTFPPAGWTVANTTTGCTGIPDWTNTDPGARGNLTGGAGAFAVADSDACGSSSVMNTEMWTSMLDLTNLTNPLVTYYTDYNDISSASDIADLDVSTDGGTTWANLISWNEDHFGPLQVSQAFPGDGQNDVLLRWNYTNATWDWWWEVDDVAITACAPDNPTAVDVSNISASPVAPVAGFPLAAIPAALTAAAAAAWVARKRFSR